MGTERDADRFLGRQAERLVEGVRVQRLRPAKHRGERFDRGADDVVLRLLRGERRAHGLRVEAERESRRRLRSITVAHDAGPQAARSAELRDLLEEGGVGGEEKGELGREPIDLETSLDRRVDVRDRIGEREGELLHRVGARLTDVVAADRDRVPARQLRGGVRDEISCQAHRRTRREDVRPARDVLLEDVVLRRAADTLGRDPLTPAHGDVHREQDRRGRVDGHGGRDLVERDALEEPREIF